MKAQSGGRSCPKESQQIRHARHTTYFAGATLGTIRHAEVRTSLRAGHAPGNSVALAKGRVLGALGRLAVGLLACPHRWQSNSGCTPVFSTSVVSAADLSFPTGTRKKFVAPQVHRATMPLAYISACGAEASDATGRPH